ncbi:MAG TPA: hypothetical protein VLV28_01835 [Gaiellaceae bacterium]|nr:hypothetical protein [Gaiellaceae bacterium]
MQDARGRQATGGRRSRLRSFALGGVVGAAGAIATARRLRRSHGARAIAGLSAFEDAPCFDKLHDPGHAGEAGAPPTA